MEKNEHTKNDNTSDYMGNCVNHYLFEHKSEWWHFELHSTFTLLHKFVWHFLLQLHFNYPWSPKTEFWLIIILIWRRENSIFGTSWIFKSVSLYTWMRFHYLLSPKLRQLSFAHLLYSCQGLEQGQKLSIRRKLHFLCLFQSFESFFLIRRGRVSFCTPNT